MQSARPVVLAGDIAGAAYRSGRPGLESDVVPPVLPVENDMSSMLGRAVGDALAGKVPPNEALEQAGKAMQAILDQFWQRRGAR